MNMIQIELTNNELSLIKDALKERLKPNYLNPVMNISAEVKNEIENLLEDLNDISTTLTKESFQTDQYFFG